MDHSAYHLTQPGARDTSVIFASPHSGRDYTSAFLAQVCVDIEQIRSSEDAFVDQLYAAAPDAGAPLLRAVAPRAFVDLNRSADELDAALIAGVRRVSSNPRVASGLGVIPRVVANGRMIYDGKIPLAVAHERIKGFWRPYHDRLQALLDESHQAFGQAILIDCHSMPHEAVAPLNFGNGVPPNVVLGDRFGASAGTSIVEQAEAAFAAAGFRVARNAPFAGAYIAQHYGRPSRRQHVLQVEIDRSIYMDEATLRPHSGFDETQARLTQVIAELAQIGRPNKAHLAAE